MDRADIEKLRQIGVILIIVGAFIPSILYPFTSLTKIAFLLMVGHAEKGSYYNPRINDLEIVFIKGPEPAPAPPPAPAPEPEDIKMSYKYPVALGILLVFMGVSILALVRQKKD